MTSRISASSSAVGAACLGHVVGDRELEAGGRDDVVDGDTGVHASEPHAVIGRLEVEHAEVA